jgi:imidazolonepropionase-like amidohydrolase
MAKKIHGLLLLVLLVFVSEPSFAITVLKAKQYLDISSGKMIQPAIIVVEHEKIKTLNPVQLPESANLIDLGDLTILPGLIDSHTHLAYSIEGDWTMRPVKETTADMAFRAAQNARITLLAGFTTVRDVGSGKFLDVALMKAVEAGRVEGPWIFPSGNALGITGGHCDATGFAPGILESGPEDGVADGVNEVLKAVRYQIKHGAKVIKTCATAGVLSYEESVGAQQYSDEELQIMVEEASRHGVRVAAHAHGSEGILAAVKAGVASIEHGSILTDEIISEMKNRGTYLVPTTYLTSAIDMESLPPLIRRKAESVLPLARKSLEKAIASGVKIAFGTDAAVFPHGDNGREFAALVDRGMDPLEAVRAATVNAADLLGVEDRGKIKKGLLADLIGVTENPLENIRTLEDVKFVMRGGKIFKNSPHSRQQD